LDVSDNRRNVPSRENKEEKKRIKRGKKVICCPQQPFEGVAKRHPSSPREFHRATHQDSHLKHEGTPKKGKRRRLKKRENPKKKTTAPQESIRCLYLHL
jgi:hypothetical protein